MLLSHQYYNHKYPESDGRGYDTRLSLRELVGPILLIGPSATACSKTHLSGGSLIQRVDKPDSSAVEVAQNKAAATIPLKGSTVQSSNCFSCLTTTVPYSGLY